MKIQRDAFLQTVISPTHLISPNDELFTSTHIKIVATDKTVRAYCSGDNISACAYIPCDAPTPGTYYFARTALEAFATKLTTDAVEITRDGSRNILRADQRVMEFLDPRQQHTFPRKPKSQLENLDTLSESDALMIQTIAQAASTAGKTSPQYNCVYATPTDHGTEIFAYNGLALAMGVLDKKLKHAVALPVPLARMAKFGNLLVSSQEVGIEGPYCLYWCAAPVKAQTDFPLEMIRRKLAEPATKLFEIDGKDMAAAVEMLDRAFKSSEDADDTRFVVKGDNLKVRVRFPTFKFEELLTVRGTAQDIVLKLPLKEHARLLPALARQPVLTVYNVGKHIRFEGDGFKLLLPLEYK